MKKVFRDTEGVCVKALCSEHRSVFLRIVEAQRIDKRLRDRLNRDPAVNRAELKRLGGGGSLAGEIGHRKTLFLNLRSNRTMTGDSRPWRVRPDCDLCRWNKIAAQVGIGKIDYREYSLPSSATERLDAGIGKVVGLSPAGGFRVYGG